MRRTPFSASRSSRKSAVSFPIALLSSSLSDGVWVAAGRRPETSPGGAGRHLATCRLGSSAGVSSPSGIPAALGRARILQPLRGRDFALLWIGVTVSLLGDGVYVVAVAWQVYDLSGAPSALSFVALAWTIPQLLFVLLGGVLSDRVERRRVLLASDLVQGIAIGAIGVLSLSGTLRLWHLFLLVPLVGA